MNEDVVSVFGIFLTTLLGFAAGFFSALGPKGYGEGRIKEGNLGRKGDETVPETYRSSCCRGEGEKMNSKEEKTFDVNLGITLRCRVRCSASDADEAEKGVADVAAEHVKSLLEELEVDANNEKDCRKISITTESRMVEAAVGSVHRVRT